LKIDPQDVRDTTLPVPTTEADLLRGLRSGDRAAFDSLFTTYSERVWRYVARLIGPRRECVADVVQETFLQIARSIEQFDPERGALWNWISGVAHHRAMVWHRSQRRHEAGLSDDRIQAERNGRLGRWFEAGRSADELIADRETAAEVRQVLAELPDDYARCLIAKYMDDQSAAEIASGVGDTVEAVRSRLTRAREAFREVFARRVRCESSRVTP
jgi:RNA polymerase sigma-70 factor (ECF subfamily)